MEIVETQEIQETHEIQETQEKQETQEVAVDHRQMHLHQEWE